MQQFYPGWPSVDALAPAQRCAPAGAATRMMFHLMSEWTRESAHFIGMRMERYADLQMALARCATPMSSVDCMTEFARQSFTDYAKEAEKCPELLSRMSEEAMVDLEAQLQPEKAPAID